MVATSDIFIPTLFFKETILLSLSIFYGMLSALTWGAGDFAGGLATRKMDVYRAVFYADFLGLLALSANPNPMNCRRVGSPCVRALTKTGSVAANKAETGAAMLICPFAML